MKATNITASRPAATFSARRCSQVPAFRRNTGTLFQRADFFEHPFRPVLRLVGAEVDFLRVLAEGLDVRGVDLEAHLPEAVGQLRLALQVLGRAPGDRLVGRGLEGFLP